MNNYEPVLISKEGVKYFVPIFFNRWKKRLTKEITKGKETPIHDKHPGSQEKKNNCG